MSMVPEPGGNLATMSITELQTLYNQLTLSVELATPEVEKMEATAAEARAILDNMKFRRGRAAYFLTMRKGQR